MLLQFVEGALAIEQVSHKKQRQCTEAKKRYPHRPLVAFRMHKHQGIHEDGQAAGKHDNKHSGENRKLQAAPLKAVEFLTIDRRHSHTYMRQLPPWEPGVAGMLTGSVLPPWIAIGAGYFCGSSANRSTPLLLLSTEAKRNL